MWNWVQFPIQQGPGRGGGRGPGAGRPRSRQGVCGWKMTERMHQGQRGFWLNQLSRIPVEGRPGDHAPRRVGVKNLIRYRW